MRVNFDVNMQLVSEICQDNKKLVNIFYSVVPSTSGIISPGLPVDSSKLATFFNFTDTYLYN